MIRYFTTSLTAFICVVAIALAQDNPPPQKQKAEPGKDAPKAQPQDKDKKDEGKGEEANGDQGQGDHGHGQ